MFIDRKLQKEILLKMREAYPLSVNFSDLPGQDQEKIANLYYLCGHGLCQYNGRISVDGFFQHGNAEITVSGLDFLEDDGGLSAILGVVTVKLHADTIRDMIVAKIESSNESADWKSKVKSQLLQLPATVLTAATTGLVQAGINSVGLEVLLQTLHVL